jgi:Ca-activated chloride channel family protein
MTFEWPWLLLGLLLIPLLGALYLLAQRRRRAYALRFASLALLEQVVTAAPGWRRHVPPLLYALSLVALLVALARPSAVVAVPRDQATAVLVVDVSGSMAADDLKPSRLAAAQQAAIDYVDQLPPSTRVGLVSFQTSAAVQVAPTTDREAIRRAIGRLRAEGGTAIGDGLASALAQVADRPADPSGQGAPAAIVLLSDGQQTAGSPAAEAASQARSQGVRVDTVGIGQRGAAPVLRGRQSVGLDESALQQIASTTGGRYFYAGESSELRAIYAGLGSQVAWVQERTEVTALFAGAGAALMLVGGLLGLRWFAQLP